MSTQPAIGIDNLVKRYAPAKGAKGTVTEGKLALDGISFDVPEGAIFGLLGPNGAGKSTLINILAGLVNKTSGGCEIWGFDIDRDRRNASRSIGIVPQEIVFDPFFTPFEVLENQAGFYGIPAALRRSEALLEAVRLADKRNAYARTLSGGMKRRLLVAKAMVHSPPILVLDEPTAGVDVDLRRQLWQLVAELNREGVTVVLTTHYLEEAEELCDWIAIINHGRLIANKPTRELVDMAREKVVEVTVDKTLHKAADSGAFNRDFIVRYELLEGNRISLAYDRDQVSAGQILNYVQQMGFTVEDVTTREADLEDVFVQLTAGAG
jgi:ABC-2 type transport system ATP-binding protein